MKFQLYPSKEERQARVLEINKCLEVLMHEKGVLIKHINKKEHERRILQELDYLEENTNEK